MKLNFNNTPSNKLLNKMSYPPLPLLLNPYIASYPGPEYELRNFE